MIVFLFQFLKSLLRLLGCISTWHEQRIDGVDIIVACSVLGANSTLLFDLRDYS
jgi:hypothetical protein